MAPDPQPAVTAPKVIAAVLARMASKSCPVKGCEQCAEAAARAALDALRSLPVEARMEAMGMERDTIDCGEHYDGRHWVEVARGS